MFVIGGLVIGAILGLLSARKRNGSGADIAQFMAVYAIGLGILGLFLTIVIERMCF
ncbi:hypothetical protein Q9295_04635 [Xinfangfangia sp. CPCC 101601]|uniref:Apolipoprotein acyltransferase n=1 Tax=Pseudogemmobacter lacusdianii TaxID=3069608 RepID=A0ABU0VVH3_9RHOB|nr:hypothetical protein [Xinfangfangia sp. CPCC 101601]MDQ2065648.1 hypothetical protein [Xinfangfangia sp. CPCC 101601]